MTGTVHVEIVGLRTSECSPFPCNEDRTCGLSGCYLSGKLNDAFIELEKVLKAAYGARVELKLTLIDDGTPDHIRTIIEREYPPIPMVLVNGRITRIEVRDGTALVRTFTPPTAAAWSGSTKAVTLPLNMTRPFANGVTIVPYISQYSASGPFYIFGCGAGTLYTA